MAVSTIPNEINGDAQISLILDTLMYSDALGDHPEFREQKYTVSEIVDCLSKNTSGLSAENVAAINHVKTYLDSHKDSEVGNLIMHSSSDQLGTNYEGAKGAAFYSVDDDGNIKDIYVAYRGTGDGRWYDNGDAFAQRYSQYQQDAAQYFDYVMGDENLSITSESNVITTGHSKGGNQAQFATLASQYTHLVDKCISIDGEGFSPEAVTYFKKLYGDEHYEQQVEKLYSVSGDNDYVNGLGVKVIPEDHTVYVKTPADTSDFANSHALFDKETGTSNMFDFSTGNFYETTDQQRDLAILSKSLSENIMQLPREEREDVCRSLMSILEYVFYLGSTENPSPYEGKGINGETATVEEYLGFIQYGDEIFSELLYTWDGNQFIKSTISDALKKYVFQIENGEKAPVIVDLICNISAYGIRWGLEPLLHQINHFVDIVSTCADIAEVLMPVIEFCSNVAKVAWKILRLTYDADYREAQKYLAEAVLIQLHTQDLHDLAGKLWAINGRLETLDSRLDSLYSKVRWRDLWSLMNADFKVCWSSRINKCANCLNDTANRFEGVEQQLLQMLE